jgi:hypothetical protein
VRLILPILRRERQPAGLDNALRYGDLAMIGVLLAIAAGFVCQGVVWLSM